MSKRVLVAGCGAVGSVFACLMRTNGHAVTALGRGPHIRAIAANGLHVGGIWGECHGDGICVAEKAADLDRAYDAVLVTCKSYQTEALLAQIGDRASPEGVTISLQNGLGNVERIAATSGSDRVLAGRVIFGAEIDRPGSVRVTVEAEPVLLGAPRGGDDARAVAWAEIFDAAGVHCQPTNDIGAALWAKVFYNAALNPLGALLGLSYGELATDSERRRVMDRVIEEAWNVAMAEGMSLAWPSVEAYRNAFYDRLVPATAGHRSSMLQDIENGRPTEIDAICGEICRRGNSHGIETSVNRLLAILVSHRSMRR